MYKVLTIAGSDSSGGAGIQADIKTITAHKMYALSAITALTAQNTLGVYDVLNSTPEFMKSQLEAIFTDIVPDAIKIGMLSNRDIIEEVFKGLKKYNAKNIVLDPVMISTSGSKLLSDDAIDALITKLFPLADIITPNILEAEVLSNIEINNKDDMVEAAKILSKLGSKAVLIKGGHSINDANDLLYFNNEIYWFYGNRINNPNTHGTGCTLSSAIACNLAKGYSFSECIKNSKTYISDCLNSMLDLGKGSGPLDHMVYIKEII